MQAAIYQSVGRITIENRAKPAPGPGEALVRVVRCGVCATDQHIHHGVFPARMPVVGGHELAGTVEAVGRGVAADGLVGQRVAVDPLLWCGQCHFCRTGRRNHCLRSAAVGVTRDGGFAEWATVPAQSVHRIGELDFAVAAMSEPLACVLWGLKMVGELVGKAVLIVGAGPIGLLWLLVARRAGAASVIVADRLGERLPLARRLGADATVAGELGGASTGPAAAAGERGGPLGGKTDAAGTAALAGQPALAALAAQTEFGFDVAVDATGSPAVVSVLPRLVAPGGTVACFGVCPPGATVAVSPYDVYRRDLRIVGGYAINETFAPAVAMLAGGAIDPRPLVSHVLALAELPRVLDELAGSPAAVKIQIAPND